MPQTALSIDRTTPLKSSGSGSQRPSELKAVRMTFGQLQHSLYFSPRRSKSSYEHSNNLVGGPHWLTVAANRCPCQLNFSPGSGKGLASRDLGGCVPQHHLGLRRLTLGIAFSVYLLLFYPLKCKLDICKIHLYAKKIEIKSGFGPVKCKFHSITSVIGDFLSLIIQSRSLM